MLSTILCEKEHEAIREEIDIEVDIRDLQRGMVLSRNLYNAQGTLVLPRKKKIDEMQLYQLVRHHLTTPIEAIYVFRKHGLGVAHPRGDPPNG